MSTRIRNTALCFVFVFCASSCLFASVTGTLALVGSEQVSAGGVWDTGTVTITVGTLNGSYSKTVSYGQFSTPASIASALAAAFSQDCNSPAYAHAAGAQITFQMRALSATLSSLQLTNTFNSAFAGPSFSDGVAGGVINLAGQPLIIRLLMTNGNAGTPITLTGLNFGTSGSVTFNGVPSTATSWSPTSIVVPIPPGATSGPVVVTTSGLASNGVFIRLTEAVSCPAQ